MDMNTMMLEDGRSDYLTMLSSPDYTTLSSPTHDYSNLPSNLTDSTYLCMSPNSQGYQSEIFSPRPNQEGTRFEFPSPTSDSEDAIEISPMLKKQEEEEDPYLKPINVHARRAEFVRQREAMKNQIDRPINRDFGYCNTPRNGQLINLNERNKNDSKNSDDNDNEKLNNGNTISEKDFIPTIIRTQDNYVNMPKQKSDLRLEIPAGFSNPSYVVMVNRETDQMKV